MNITNLRTARIGSHAHRYLSEIPRTGIVVSVFQHGLNVLFNGDSDPGFVSIQSPETPLHPWAIEIPNLARVPTVETAATVELDVIHFDNELTITIVTAGIRELRIKSWSKEEADLAQERIPLLGAFLQAGHRRRPTDPFQSQIEAILESWRQSGRANDLFGLIGLGSGSTPSGDDILVGMLAACSALGTTTLALALRTAGIRQRTHPVSAQMLGAVIDGAFPQSLRDLANQLGQAASTTEQLRQCVETLANQGATSGTAMLVGFTTAYSWQSET